MKVGFIEGLILSLFIVNISHSLEIELVSHSNQGATIKINLPDFRSEKKIAGDSTYQRITVDGWGRTATPGFPQLPMRGILVGIPSLGTIKTEVIQADVEELSGLNIYPSPQKAAEEKDGEIFLKDIFYLDKEAYARDSYGPGELVQVSETGYMRGQKVAKIDIYPFQYNPVQKKLKFYREMLIRVRFEGGQIAPLTFSKEELPYEKMLQKLLLNYESLGRYEGKNVETGGGASEQAAAVSIPNLKIHMSSEGIYKIGYSNLSSLWSSLGTIDPRKIHLKHLGAEIPIMFKGDGDLDGTFNQTDSFLFYAPPLPSYYTEFTKDDVYWLSVESTNGQRMFTVDGAPRGGQLLTSFDNLYHGEEDNVYWETIPNGEGVDHYFWAQLTPPSTSTLTINFPLNNILSTSDNCTLTLDFRGKTDQRNPDGTDFTPDHHTQVTINGNIVEDNKWNGQIEFQTTITFPQSYLQNGTNTLTVKSVGDTGATVDTVYFNWFDLSYTDTYVAESNTLKFKGTGSGDCEIDVSGFTSSDINLIDITDAVNPRKVIDATIASGTIKFAYTISGTKEYMAVATGNAKAPASIEADIPSSLKSVSNGADYIIITHEDFYNAIQPLAAYRESQGKRVMVVKVGDVYDEFSYGLFDPQTIKDFLTYAYENYQPAPLYCLLVGDANIDYKDNLNTGRKNYVPTHIYQTAEIGDTPTDNWFVCVSGNDILPDIYLGRISCQTPTEVTNVVNKILSYEQAGNQSWNQQALFVADNDGTVFDSDGNLIAVSPFETVNNILINDDYLPNTYQSNKVYLSNYDINKNNKIEDSEIQTARNALKSFINSGQLMTVYVGHGSVDNWAAESLFTSLDVPSLSNSSKLTFVVTLTCLNGFFASPVDDYCLGETFLNGYDANKKTYNPIGAVGCLVPTSLGFTWEHQQLAQDLFDSIFQYGHNLLGQATTEAKLNAYGQGVPSDIIQAFVFLGDPYSALKTLSNTCSAWSDVITKYNEYVSGLAAWSDVIDCYNGYVSQ